ncbi:sigma-70 family RNA polymerase sigma factor [Streptomyces sp. ME19-01-6]|uniref:sigma-70 family RNA polymerase sigma factor n=1 Tax=Streptomyces sp. ME19-01-6 TaxID=3028686 RepID=UPI0029B97B5A|nr:sigma-70 family RNA polymerase sigma factor [Streptomyces sp. ME19-01-6]MDX3227380.1 sigma-70 family RNA polymerase sigma factor [Streptomyces sp. ME19-01-6]
MANDAPPRWDRRMQQRLARGEAAALGELYDRFASLVHNLAHRVLDDEEAADRVTREVFGYAWENPDAYDPKQGTLRSWIATLAHRQAVHRLREAEARAAADPAGDNPTGDGPAEDAATGDDLAGGRARRTQEDIEEKIREASVAARADYIVTSMPAPLRAALELAYFDRRDYRQTAAELGVTEDEARRRLRLGLQLLSTANVPPPDAAPPPGYGRAL